MLVISSKPQFDIPDLYYIISVTNGPEISIHLSFQFVLLCLVNQYNPEISCIYTVIFIIVLYLDYYFYTLIIIIILTIPMYNTL